MALVAKQAEERRNPQVVQDIEGPGDFNFEAYEIVDNNIPSKN